MMMMVVVVVYGEDCDVVAGDGDGREGACVGNGKFRTGGCTCGVGNCNFPITVKW